MLKDANEKSILRGMNMYNCNNLSHRKIKCLANEKGYR